MRVLVLVLHVRSCYRTCLHGVVGRVVTYSCLQFATPAGTFSQLQSHHVKMPEELGKLELWFDVAVVVSLATKRAGLAWSHKSKS